MDISGQCYCGAVKYEISGDPVIKVQCHCRECQYLAGGGPNFTMGFTAGDFKYTKGTAKQFSRPDLDDPVTREFCPDCGTQMVTLAPFLPDVVLIKIGTLDEPGVFSPDMAIFTCDKQSFHHVPDGMPAYEQMPG